MSLFDIFDPIVRAHFANKSGGLSIADTGYCIDLNLKIENPEVIDLSAVGLKYTKRTKLVLSGEEMIAGNLGYGGMAIPAALSCGVIKGDGWDAIYDQQGTPMIIGGVAGDYNYNGLDVHVPSNGTYFLDELSNMYDRFYRTAL